MSVTDNGRILEAVIARTIGTGRAISFRSVRESIIPAGIKEFLLGDLLVKYGRERNFHNGPLQEALLRTLAIDHRYERAEFLSILAEATGFLSRYLPRPQEGLIQWILGNRSDVSVETMNSRLKFVADYRYLSILIDGWVRRRGMTTISKNDLSSILPALDARVVSSHSKAELALLARPIFRFFLFGSDKNDIPTALLDGFYREKHLTSVLKEVERKLGSITSISLRSFLKCFEPPPVVTPPPEPANPKSVPVIPPKEEVTTPPEPKTEQEPSAVSLSGEIPDLSHCISDEQRNLFVNAVFENDDAYYTAVISSLNGLQTWKEAALFLSEFYQTNRLDPFAAEVVEFTDVIHKRYAEAGAR